ncbi:MAG TPA: acyltransferase domain-containing protein, partial [Thermoanaerobaculia bacterium]|nr:acyltransferase domain-containing protein [Thermoanaerobaculia bacterium]
FWKMLCAGVDATREVPADRWDAAAWYDPDPQAPGTINTRRGAFLDRVDGFDPLFFGISPREAAEMDPQQRLMLELAWEALEDAGIPPRSLAGRRAGVFVGVIGHDYADLHRAAGAEVTSHSGPGTSLSIVANRISYLLGLRGPSLSVDTACSSSLVSVHLACRSLRDGESSLALAGGVNLILTPEVTVELTKFGGLSGDGRCKAFDARADGFARGEGGGLAVLKPLSAALADGDFIYCLIRGGAVNNDGASNGLTAPNPRAQVEVLEEAYARAGVDPGRVGYVEAHGTGTRLGDPIEARALAEVLCAGRAADRPLILGSVKTNVGHQEGAAGIAGLLKLALALHHRAIPPSLHFATPNPDIPFDELRLRVPTSLGEWPGEEPAVGGVSSFGWGGTNCHLVLEEASPAGRVEPPARRPAPPRPEAPVFVFAGMGWQWPGMARELLREPLFRARLERCDRVMRPLRGWSLFDDLLHGDDERWLLAEVAIPGLFAFQAALADLWRSWGVEPAAVVGHSCGEIAAAYVAGALDLDQASTVAAAYGRALGFTDHQGAIGVAALAPEAARERIAGFEGLEVAGWLSPASAAVAGPPAAVDAFLAAVQAEGRFAARAAAVVPAHTAAVEPYLAEMAEALAGLAPRRPRLPMVSTLSGEIVDGPALDSGYWTANLRRPVLFSQAVAALLAAGHRTFLAIDGHPVLATPLEQCFAHAGVEARWLPSLWRGRMDRTDPTDQTDPTDPTAWTVLGESLRALDPRPREEGATIVPLSARSPEALRELAAATSAVLREPEEDWTLADLGHRAALGRSHHEERLALVARTRDELAAKLEGFARGESVAGAAVGRRSREPGGLVFAFSGQGPQWPGMGRQLLAAEPVFRDAVERCEEALRPWLGGALRERLEEEDALARTELAQPAIFALQVGLTELWRSWGVVPGAVVGHSVGEVVAAWAAGVLTLDEAARVAAVRGRAMEGARGRGGMVAVEMPEAEARALVADLGLPLEVAAVNGPASTVLAGPPEALDKLGTGRRLRVDYAFHTAQMEPFDAQVEAELTGLQPRPAAVPLVSTVTGRPLEGPEMDGAYWRRNVRQPVRFADAVATLAAGHATFLEIGPHPVLASAIVQGIESAVVLASLRRGRDERETLLESVGGLWVLGHRVDWRGVFPDGGRRAPLPTYPFQRQRYWFAAPSRPAPPPAPTLQPAEPALEELLAGQLDAFNRMVALQLAVLGRPEDLDA